jgi:SAM-dependent methyltransferase
MLFRYREPAWYAFGTTLGWKNLLKNGNTLGAKKTVGKILQPINSYTRFPEYHFFAEAIGGSLRRTAGQASRPRILDVGSPKLLGLYLAYHEAVDVHLTDISRLNVAEYKWQWDAIRAKARGRVFFSLQDARNISEANHTFDVVYSMSVIEHIEQDLHDPRAISELLRVLKPGGELALSVPIGRSHVEQFTSRFSYEADQPQTQQAHFFQRIFDQETARKHIVEAVAPYVDDLRVYTIFRQPSASAYHAFRSSFGDSLHGALGFTNPLWSRLYNRHHTGLQVDFNSSYGDVRSPKDVYGDLFVSGRKR